MHRGFFDKRRRFLNLRRPQVENVLPEHFIQFYPKFITLLRQYYDWQQEEPSTELIAHLFATRDINETDITLLSYIEDELLLGEAYFEGFGDTDAEKRAAANFSNILFRSKGSKFAIEWFFRSFYGLDAEVFYPKENIFVVGDAQSTIGPDSLRFLTNEKLYQTFAILIRVGVPISKWRDIYKLFVHPAGMYLGAEISINDAITAPITTFGTTDSDVVVQRAASVYTLQPYVAGVAKDSADEGQNVNWLLTATNIPDNIGAVNWYVTNISVDSSEFYDSANVPRIASPAYLALNDSAGLAAGRFDLKILNDDNETEGDEQYKVSIVDAIGKVLAEKTMTINDVVASYVITSDLGTTITEGDSATYTITGTNVPNDGTTTLYWYLNPITATYNATNADFATVPPRVFSRQAITLVNSTASFSLKPIVDDIADDGVQFRILLRKTSTGGTNLATYTVTINDYPYSIAASVPNITEGQNIVATITVDPRSIGDIVDWSISGPGTGRLEATVGEVTMTSASVDVIIETTADDTYYSPNTLTFTATSPGGGTVANDTFTITDLAPTYEVTASPETAGPGDSVVFTLTGTNIPDGNVYFFVVYGTATSADFTATPPLTASRETVAMVSNSGSASSITFTNDLDASNESFTVFFYNAASGGTELGSLAYTIVAESYTLTASDTSLNEGDSVTYTFTGSDGTYYYWLTGVASADFTSGYASTAARQSFVVSGGSGTFTLVTAVDLRYETNETITANVSQTSSSGVLITNSTVVISDTSTPTYTVAASDVVEGASFVPTLTRTTGAGSETVYIEMTGAAAARFTTTTGIVKTFTTNTTVNLTEFGNASYSDVYAGPLTGTINVRRGSSVGTIIATDTFTLSDAAATYVLAASDTTPDEGDPVAFTLSGTNIQNGTYYYRASGIIAQQTDQSSASGQAKVYVGSTTGLSIGMETDNASITGTILSINTNDYVTMSTNLTGTVSSGTAVFFATPALWDDFSSNARGSFTVTANSGNFNVSLASDTDTTNDAYTFSVYSTATSTSVLVSESITIQDLTPSNIVTLASVAASYSQNTTGYPWGEYAVQGLRFHTDGRITRSKDEGGRTDTLGSILVGYWVTSTAGLDASKYTVKFNSNRISYSGAYFPFPGGYYVADDSTTTGYPSDVSVGLMSIQRDFGVEVQQNLLTGANATYDFTIEIYETANPSNYARKTVRISATCFYAASAYGDEK